MIIIFWEMIIIIVTAVETSDLTYLRYSPSIYRKDKKRYGNRPWRPIVL
jgi:hypothetical protein